MLKGRRSGQALIEFSLIALVLYLILAATLEFGRLIFSAQVAQDSARVAAREIALTPLPADSAYIFSNVYTDARTKPIFDETKLVLDLTGGYEPLNDPTLPIVNRMLLPLYVYEVIGTTAYLHYPGAVVNGPTGLTVLIPTFPSQATSGPTNIAGFSTYTYETSAVTWLHVVEDFTMDAAGQSKFQVANGGLVTLRINYPFQAAMLSSFHQVPDPATGGATPAPDIESPVIANDDGAGGFNNIQLPLGYSFFKTADDGKSPGVYAGNAGLGRLEALGQVVRPFRRVISVQAVFRREVFSSN